MQPPRRQTQPTAHSTSVVHIEKQEVVRGSQENCLQSMSDGATHEPITQLDPGWRSSPTHEALAPQAAVG